MTQPLIRIAQIEQEELALVIRTVIQTTVPLDDLLDVNVAGATNGQILEYSTGSPTGWIASANSGGGLGDVILGSPITKGEFLVYQGSPSIWVNTDAVKLNVSVGSPEVVTTFQISSTLPSLSLNETDGPANEKIWRFEASGGDFVGEMLSDSGGSSNRWINVTRSGITNSDLIFYVGAQAEAFHAVAGAEVQLYHNAVNVAETTTAAAGGLRVNNLSTGAGFERVLTTSDIGGGGGGGSGVTAGQGLYFSGSPEIILNVGAGDGLQIIGSPKSIAVDATVLRTSSALNDLGDVAAGSPTLGAILYSDGTNWIKLNQGTNGQVLTMGSPLLPVWRNNTGGSPVDTSNIVGGDGIIVTTGSPEVSIAVDATVFRTTNTLDDISDVIAGSPTTGTILYNDGTNWLKLPIGTNGQVLTVGSPLLPVWKVNQGSAGGGSPLLDIRGGVGIDVTFGSPKVLITNTLPNVDQNLWDEFRADSGNAVAAGTNEKLTIAGGAGINTSIGGSPITLTITNIAVGSPSTYIENIVGGDGITVTTGSPEVTVAVDNTVFRTTDPLGDISDVSVGSPSQYKLFYNDGTNWTDAGNGSPAGCLTWDGLNFTIGSAAGVTYKIQGNANDSFPRATVLIGSDQGDAINNAGVWYRPDVSSGVKKNILFELLDEGTNTTTMNRFGMIIDNTGSPAVSRIATSTNVGATSGTDIGITTQGILSNDFSMLFDESAREILINDDAIFGGSPILARITDSITGGMEVRNLATGSGLERVLTTSDLNTFGGGGSPVQDIVGGDGIDITFGSPVATISVDSTVARLSAGSPGLINTGTFIIDTVDFGARSTQTTYETTTTSTSQAPIASYSISNYRSAEFLIEAVQGSNYHVTKLLTTHDGTNAFLTEYGTVSAPEFFGSPAVGSPGVSGEQATYTVDVSGGNLRLLATPVTASSTLFTTTATIIKIRL